MNGTVELDGLLSDYLRKKRKEQVLPFLSNARKILDVGCGKFLWEENIKEDQYYLGIDMETDILDKNISRSGIEFMPFNINITDPSIIGDGFDLIILLASIEHFLNPENVLLMLNSKLIDNGLIVLTTPAPWGKYILETGAVFGIFAKDKHQHQKLLGKQSIKKLAKRSGLEVIKFNRFLFFQNQLAVMRKTN